MKDGELDIAFNYSTKTVEVYFELKRSIVIVAKDNERLPFEQGAKFLIFLSRRFDEEDLAQLFSSAALRIRAKVASDDHAYALVLAGTAA